LSTISVLGFILSNAHFCLSYLITAKFKK